MRGPLVAALALVAGCSHAPTPEHTMKRLTLSEVVVDEPVAYDQAIASPVPPELGFALEGEPVMHDWGFELHGVLTNHGDAPVRAVVFPTVGTPFYAEVELTPEITWWRDGEPGRPNLPPRGPPPAPPPPLAIRVPPHGQVELTTEARTELLKYRGAPETKLVWQLLFWNEPRPHGELAVRLPPRS